MAWKVKQPIDFGNTDLFRPVSDFHDLISGPDLAFFDDSEIKPRTLMRNEQGRHLRIPHAYANSVASHSRLGHLEYRITNPVTIPKADLIVGEAVNRKVLAKLSVLEVVLLKVILPVAIGVELIHHHRAMLPAMPLQVPLAIPVEIETASHHPTDHRLLPDSGVNDFALPHDLTRETYIH